MPLCICGTVLTDVRGTDEQIRWAPDTSLPHAASGRRIHRDGGIVETAKYCFLCRDCRDGCRDCWFLCRDCRDGKVKEGHLDDSNSLTVPTVPTQKPTVPTTVPTVPTQKATFCRLISTSGKSEPPLFGQKCCSLISTSSKSEPPTLVNT